MISNFAHYQMLDIEVKALKKSVKIDLLVEVFRRRTYLICKSQINGVKILPYKRKLKYIFNSFGI